MTSHRVLPTGLVLAGLLLVAACGDNPGTSTAPGSTAAATTATTAAPTTTVDPAKAKAEVTAAFTKFFENFSAPPALLEDGDKMSAAIESLRGAASKVKLGVAVKDAKVLDAAGCSAVGVPSPCAEVKFDLVVDGTPAVPDQTGYAVEQNGTWKVSKTTLCTLAALGSGAPEGC